MVVLIIVGGASPASAHMVSGVSASNYLTTLNGLAPTKPGLRMRVVETGSRLELTNTSNVEVLVVGYNDEPYLRIGPKGVFENQRSPATYLNASRQASTPIPSDASANAEPVWKKVSGEPVARWHDHRAHWMGSQDPPEVTRDPGRRHVVYDKWEIKMSVGGDQVVATGQLLWIPGPSPVPWLAVTALLAALAIVSGLVFGMRGVAIVIAVLVPVDLVHSVAIAWSVAGPFLAKFGSLLGGNLFNILLWVVGAVAVRPCWRRNDMGLMPAAIAGLFLAIFGGLLDLSGFWKSQIPFALSAGSARAMVAVITGLGLGSAVVSVLTLWRNGTLVPQVAAGALLDEPGTG